MEKSVPHECMKRNDNSMQDEINEDGTGRPKIVALSNDVYNMQPTSNILTGIFHFAPKHHIDVCQQVWKDNTLQVLMFWRTSDKLDKDGKPKRWNYTIPVSYLDALIETLVKIRNVPI